MVDLWASFGDLYKSKINLLLTLVPIFLGLILYYYLGMILWDFFNTTIKTQILSMISQESLGVFLYWLVFTLLIVLFFFVLNWTFVLVVNLLAAPFNDFLSERIEKSLRGEPVVLDEMNFFKRFIPVMLNEAKKVLFIIVLSIFSLLFSFFAVLAPLSLLFNCWLIAIGYTDLSWSRHSLSFRECLGDFRKNLMSFGLSGGFFSLLIMIPIFNLLVPSWGTSYYTRKWVQRHSTSID